MATSLVDIPIDGEGKPLTIICQMNTTQEKLRENVEINLKRDLPRFLTLPGILHARHQPIAICGGGPSLNDHVDEIKKFTHVMACGSVHDHLVELGITPSFAIAVDGLEDAVKWFQKPQPQTSFLLASQCHPNMFERMKDHKIAIWNFSGQIDDLSVFNGEPQICWGCMVGNHSIPMSLYLGFQELHFFGMDGNHADGRHHAYDVGEHDAVSTRNMAVFSVNGKEFVSTTALISQMEHFFDIFASTDGKFIKGYVHGDGLWANVIKASPPEMAEWLEAV